MMTKEQAKKLIDKALSFSTFPECNINLNSSESASIRFALNGITTSGYTIEQSMTISSAKDGQTGNTSIDEFDDNSIREAVKRTEALALISPPNPERVPPLGPQKYAPYENFAESTAKARNDVMIPHVRAIIEGAKAQGLVAAGFFEREASAVATATKQGNFGFGRQTDASLSTTIRTQDGSSSGWASQPAVRIDQIDGAAIGKTAIDKCVRWKNPKRLDPGKYTVVLEPTAVGDLIQLLGFNFQARSAEEGRSFLSKPGGGTLVGEKLFPESITLHSDPFNSLYSGLPWGGGGLPAAPMAWIEKGVVKNLFYDRYWAAKAGKAPTPFPFQMVLDGGDKSLSEMIASVERGLLVTRFWYIRNLNPKTVQFTGLTRDGLFLIENGKVTSPVVNFRFNESPVRLLQNTIAMGKPVRVRGGEGQGMIAPPLVVKEFPFTSISDAV
ncbi:TldD/PmbA family protein [Paludibaculum fermentans]|uniref:TldD/PmbA family protein n=1 Tax=Paludibaculum fermentans TaxID=1473598 RepID=A0A7S7NU00_PALFE|nr:TldD/PmbA family protein [Paludibaculum fermentans]QOY89795.1 TldD/PmbA family protein [Paludibaculum fermentans]